MLLSQDAYPLHSFEEFTKKINGESSMFNLINTNGPLTKTSQWWILHRDDVKLILENNEEYRKIFNINKKSDGAFDEFYFLSLLKWLNPTHKFVDKKVMYDDFQEGTIQKSPKIYNKLIECDKNKMVDSYFIRKVTPNFSLETYKIKKELKIVFIGTETDQQNILSALSNEDFDLFILSAIKIELIHPDILSKSICVIQIIYKFLLETILSLSYEKCLESWNSIIFTTEKYDLSKPYNLDGLSLSNLPLKNKVIFPNIKQFIVIKDTNGIVAYYKKNENYNKMKKIRIPRNKYIPNLPTFKDWESPSYDDQPQHILSPDNDVISPPYIPLSPTNTPPHNDDVISPPYIPPSSPTNTPPHNDDVPVHIYTSSNNEPFIVPKCVRKVSASPNSETVSEVKSPKSVMIKVKRRLNVLEPQQFTGMTLKIGKKCPKGTKTHKINDKVYCKTVVDKKDKVLSNNIAEKNDNITIKIGKKCPKGTKTHKINDKVYCKKNV